uniref:Polyunsaturated fatty acid synthase subunit B n=1 Tax=Thraustochytrium sp. (strain ATCC 26185 / S-3) TaxID=672127 RepID=PFA2_THRS2|nr:RecName: Full=Polyunsaturated fatty acid synthase subunit B; Short=PUFAs-B [Thraustochytrium sp. ATCC 26185]AOG21005.1 polyunsaturated fatty acid synthase subunit B [Thraustochytrium sp. ATCC 26185]
MAARNVSAAHEMHDEKRIAVVGMAVQYAGCKTKDEFWEVLMNGKVESGKISDKRLGSNHRAEHYKAQRSKYADTFCNETYGCLDENEVDNEHELLLSLAKQALAETSVKDSTRCGIVSGCLSFPMDNLQGELLNVYQSHVEKKLGARVFKDASHWSEREQSQKPEAGDRRVFMDPASFVAEELNLGALHYSVDAACATALYVLRLAQDHLVSGAADVMLCGATCLPEPFFILSGFSTFQAMPVGTGQGVSMPLHKDSQGLTPGEGGSIMVLKRLEDAVRDGDHIYGTLLGANLSNAGTGLPLKPLLPAEKACLMDTYKRVNVHPHKVQYVECHATGTPQGDRVEIDAVKACFEGKVPRFGTTKGNFGHTLVAAGFAGMCKVLLAMKHGVIPPTPGIDASTQIDPLVVAGAAIPWPETDGEPKRAGLSAFGFGGTNAHAVFEEHDPSKVACAGRDSVTALSARCGGENNMRIAITGMDATFGALKGLDAFERAIYTGTHGAIPLPEKRWRFLGKDRDFLDLCGVKSTPHGCYIEDVEVDFQRLRTPMTPEDMLLPQQLLAVTTIDRAILDSGMEKGGNVAVFVGLGTDLELYRHRARVALKERLRPEAAARLDPMMQYINDCGTSTSYTSYIGNLVATRVSSQWGFTGPSFTITEGNNSVYRCAELGKYLLETGEVDGVVIAGVDLCGSAENLYVKSRRFKVASGEAPRASFDAAADGYFVGEGCGALVLKRETSCTEKDRIYACVDAIVPGNMPGACLREALDQARVQPGAVEMLELSADSARHLRDASVLPKELTAEEELATLQSVLADASKLPRHVAAGSVKATVGDTGYASGAASLIKAALCVHNRYLPSNGDAFEGPAPEAPWGEALFACQSSRAWLKNPGERRYAAVSGVSETRSCYSVLLSDAEGHHERENRQSLDEEAPKLIVLRADSHEEILARLDKIRERFLQPTGAAPREADLKDQARRLFLELLGETLAQEADAKAGRGPQKRLALSIVSTPAKLQREVELAAKGIPRCLKMRRDWTSPAGSRYAPEPLASDRVAFMYGEGRSPYYGILQDMHRIWPALHEVINEKTTSLWSEGDRWVMPRASSKAELEEQREAFDRNQIEMFRLGILSSMSFTTLARDVLNITPKAAFGLSLGEISMLFSYSDKNGKNSDRLTRDLRASRVWNEALAIEFNALREAWGISKDTPKDEFWQGYIVHGTKQAIEDAIAPDSKYVRLTIINDGNSALISGKPDACKAAIARLGSKVPALPVSQGMCGHCPEVAPYAKEIAEIHQILDIPDTDVNLFSSVSLKRLVPRSTGAKDECAPENVGEYLSELYTRQADFPAIVETVYKQNYDIFVEAGPNNHRSSAVRATLGPQRSHVTGAMDKQNEDAWTTIVKLMATLQAHRVPGATIAPLYHTKLVAEAHACYESFAKGEKPKKNKFVRKIQVNGRFDPKREPISAADLEKLPPADPSIESAIAGRVMTPVAPKFYSRLNIDQQDEARDPILNKDNQPAVAPAATAAPTPKPKPAASSGKPVPSADALRDALLSTDRMLSLGTASASGDLVETAAEDASVIIPPCAVSDLGSRAFMKTYGVNAPMYTGAMAKGIASADLVIAAGKQGMLGSFGAGGLPMHLVREAVDKIQAALPHGPYAVNLIHSPFDSNLEKGNVDLFLEKGVTIVEASAFMTLTPQVVRYRAAGLSRNADGSVRIRNRLIGKVSRTELAGMFMRPAPENLLEKLIASGEITQEQAELARRVPVADDIAVEADSGGHTDNRPIHVILPLIINLRDRVHRECGFPPELRVRVGAGGGIGCPQAALAAFNMGAAFIVTGTVNQLAKQSGTCDNVRKQLSKATYSDVCMAPAADMFEEGVKLQVLKKGTMFPSRANKLYELFCKYDSFESMAPGELERVEKRIFKRPLQEVWDETKDFYINRLHNPEKIQRAEERDPKLKMSLCFRWYLGLASRWANTGASDRVMDYQVWCGPAIGSYNDFVKGTYLDPEVSGEYPCVVQINKQILRGACFLRRLETLRNAPLASSAEALVSQVDDTYVPANKL